MSDSSGRSESESNDGRGEAWTSDEENELWKCNETKSYSLKELAIEFKRSEEAIEKKLRKLAERISQGKWRPSDKSQGIKSFKPGSNGTIKTEGKPRRAIPPGIERTARSSVDSFVRPGTTMSDYDDENVESQSWSDPIEVSNSQMKALQAIASRKSVFYTGAAGTGKSFITGVLKDILAAKGMSGKMAVTAPTGVAACNIGGQTIHSWAGVGLGDKDVEKLVGMIKGKGQGGGDSAFKRWKETDILVIDEVSMLSGELFIKLSQVGQRIRGDCSRPFGGLQVILCGDFFQLPPVMKTKSAYQFAFQTPIWKELLKDKDQSVVLDKVFRQKDGPLLRILNDMRRGVVTEETRQVLDGKVKEWHQEQATKKDEGDKEKETVQHTILFPRNHDVGQHNRQKLESLSKDDAQIYKAKDISEKRRFHLLNDLKAPEVLELRVGAQVMLLKNLNQRAGLINGARGVVTAFDGEGREKYPVVEFSLSVAGKESKLTEVIESVKFDIMQGEEILASRSQLPLMLAWAITVHKSQGLTIRELDLTFANMFEYGQGYVALSRAVDLEGLRLRKFDPTAVKANYRVTEFYQQLGYERESVSDDTNTVRTSIEELAANFKEMLPKATDYKGDAEWIQGGQTGENPLMQHQGDAMGIDDFDANFNQASKGWASLNGNSAGNHAGSRSGNHGGRVGHFASIQSLLDSSVSTEEYKRRLDAEPNLNAKSKTQSQPKVGLTQHSYKAANVYTNTSTDHAFGSKRAVPFKDEESVEMDPGYLNSLKAQKKKLLERPHVSSVISVNSFAVPVPITSAPAPAPAPQLSEEARERIQKNKEIAMKRRQAHMASQNAVTIDLTKPYRGV